MNHPPPNRSPSRKRPFVIDYQVVGTLHLSCRNAPAARLRAEGLLRAAVRDLQDISVYCEDEMATPIDALERYRRNADAPR